MNIREFELAVVFSLKDLSRISGISPKRVRRLLESSGVRLLRSGRRFVVSRVALETAVPEVFESLRQRVRRGAVTMTADARVLD